jgi:hypothetical protein
VAAVTMPVAVADGEHPEPAEDEEPVEEMEIDVDAGQVEEVDDSEDTNGDSSGKCNHTSACWEDFVLIFDENG